MKITILTLFPEMFKCFVDTSIIKRAIEKKQAEIKLVDIRDYTLSKHKKVDDTPFGGGSGMVMSLQPVVDAIKANSNENTHIILMSAKGTTLKQKKVRDLAIKHQDIMIICGHYEGIDERITNYINEEISIGDYIITGGELSSMVLSDSIIRVLDGVIKEDSHLDESYEDNLLEYPHYTKPSVYDGHEVPSVLLSGHHENIRKFRLYKALETTYQRRKDLLVNREFTKEEKKILEEIEEKDNGKY